MKKPLFMRVIDLATQKNFLELTRLFSDMFDGALAKPTVAVLATGDNPIPVTVPNPQGRIITYQSAAASLFDKGMVAGKWVINASAPCTIHLAFF